MQTHRLLVAAVVAILTHLVTLGVARADTITNPSTEYLNRIKVGETIQPLGETPFGESVSLYTGTLSFRQTDISFPGIGPDIVLTRTYEASGSPLSATFDLAMADWDLAVPVISTIIPFRGPTTAGSWSVDTSAGFSDQRCTHFGRVSQGYLGYGLAWRHGIQLITGDGGSQPVLKRTAENQLAPGNPDDYPALTPNLWMFSCLPTTSNGQPGEGFMATSPDGTRYWFDHLAYGAQLETLVELIPWMNNPGETIPRGAGSGETSLTAGEDAGTDVYWGVDNLILKRKMGFMYATRVEDRFGNWVTYDYIAGRLQEIKASDGRRVKLVWRTDAPLVDTITLQPDTEGERVWSYHYDVPTDPSNRRLVRVVQPDLTTWELETAWASGVKLPGANPDNECNVRSFTQIPGDDNYAGILMTHPTGLQGRFDLSIRAHARSWVPTSCAQLQGATGPYSEHIPPVYLSLSLTSKTFSGPGVSPLAWQYRYSPAAGSTEAECQASPCKDWQWVEVTDPGLDTTHYRYSTRWGALEGKLLMKVTGVSQRGTDHPVGLERETYTYAEPLRGWAFPARLGEVMQDTTANSNNDPSERMSPEVSVEKERQGVRFARQVVSFDRFGNPTMVRRGATPGDARNDQTEYWPVDARWVLGQPWKSWSDGQLVSQTDYDPRVLPARTYGFGKFQASYTYAGNGQLASISDGRGNVTTLADHKRGVPQDIRFPDGTTIAPSVDDFGQVVSVRNQLQDSTRYRYDSMGRLVETGFPLNDTVAWNPVYRRFARQAVSQYGLPPFHWKLEVQTGNALVSTFHDVLWRPRLILTEDLSNPLSKSYVVKRYDDAGREVFSSYPVSVAPSVEAALSGVHTTYDALGRETTVRQDSELGSLVATREYLPGFRTRTTNPRGFSTITSFQTFDSPSEELPIRIEAPEGVTTVIERDIFGKPLTIQRLGPAN